MGRNSTTPSVYTAPDPVTSPQGETVHLADPVANHLFNVGERAGFPNEQKFEPTHSGA